ncbi:catechol 2,3-dioxygenase-like lactoylglutathione lyase family enzyme [Streptomyces filamentosus]|uniref:VOC family protein n=1 Tax=Streptomyces filamentosus TaxID=67294 RepID=UPI0036E4CBA9
MFGKLTVTKIFCTDLDVMVAFYRDRLGLAVREEYPGHTVVFDTGHGGELIVSKGDKPVHIAFTEADIPAAHAALKDLGATEIVPHKTGERFELTDPEGNHLIFVNA